MSQTARLSQEAYEKVEKISEEEDKPMIEVVDELIVGDLDQADRGEVVGYCPGCGFEFVEDDLIERTLLADAVRCPVETCVKHGRSEKGKKMRKPKLLDQPPEHVEEPPTPTDGGQIEEGES